MALGNEQLMTILRGVTDMLRSEAHMRLADEIKIGVSNAHLWLSSCMERVTQLQMAMSKKKLYRPEDEAAGKLVKCMPVKERKAFGQAMMDANLKAQEVIMRNAIELIVTKELQPLMNVINAVAGLKMWEYDNFRD